MSESVAESSCEAVAIFNTGLAVQFLSCRQRSESNSPRGVWRREGCSQEWQ
jgi:hypothetical protein